MRVVLDTNVIVAAFAARGLCATVFEVCIDNHTIVTSLSILSEVERNLIKKIHLPDKLARTIMDYLREVAERVIPEELDKSACRDIDDIKVIGTALKGNARFIITGDNDLLVLKKFRDVGIMTPREFWNRLRIE